MYEPAKQYDPNTAMLVELIPGLFGFLGIGYLYVGRTNDGIIRLIAWLIAVVLLWIGYAIAGTVTCGFGFCLLPIVLMIQVAVPIWPGLTLKKELEGGLA